MEFARFRTRATALLALGVLALAAVFVGGCAAPDDDERATFGTVAGVVQDTAGNPVAGATVRLEQAGVPDLPGVASVITDASGQFIFPSVQVSGALLSVVAEAPGFLPSVGRVSLANGATVTRFAVANTGVTTVTVVLQAVDTSVQVGPGGTTLTVGGDITIAFPAGAVPAGTTVSATRLSGTGLPVAASDLSRSRDFTPGTTQVFDVPVVAVAITPDGLVLNTAATVTANLPLPLSTAPLWRFDFNANAWVPAGFAELLTPTQARFDITTLGTYMISLETTWTFGAAVPQSTSPFNNGPVTASFPPLTSGEAYSVALPVQLDVNTLPTSEIAFLKNAFAAIASEPADGFVREVIPPGGTVGKNCVLNASTVQVSYEIPGAFRQANGTRFFWICTETSALPPVVTPPHFQGHGQGGGTGG